jgi:HAD superfamily hydrolase (TIGR01509 family)
MQGLNHSTFDAVALDFDGTLVDSENVHLKARSLAYRQVSEEFNEPRLATIDSAIHDQAQQHGSSAHDRYAWIVSEAGIAIDGVEVISELVKRKQEIYLQLTEAGIESRPGAVDFLVVALRRWSEKTSIVTVAYRNEVMPFLGANGLSSSFNNKQLVTHEDVAHHKPDPEAYLKIIDRFGLGNKPERLLVVEDTPIGVEAARTAGAIAIGMLTPEYGEALQRATGLQKPHALADNFLDLRHMTQL